MALVPSRRCGGSGLSSRRREEAGVSSFEVTGCGGFAGAGSPGASPSTLSVPSRRALASALASFCLSGSELTPTSLSRVRSVRRLPSSASHSSLSLVSPSSSHNRSRPHCESSERSRRSGPISADGHPPNQHPPKSKRAALARYNILSHGTWIEFVKGFTVNRHDIKSHGTWIKFVKGFTANEPESFLYQPFPGGQRSCLGGSYIS
eukprot:scaffold87498_cov34-Tisochrysis_lutea.AAC.1